MLIPCKGKPIQKNHDAIHGGDVIADNHRCYISCNLEEWSRNPMKILQLIYDAISARRQRLEDKCGEPINNMLSRDLGCTHELSTDIIDDLEPFYHILVCLVRSPRYVGPGLSHSLERMPQSTCWLCASSPSHDSALVKERLFMTKEPPRHQVSLLFGAYTMVCLLDNFYRELKFQYLYKRFHRGPISDEELWCTSQRAYDYVLLELQRAIKVFDEAERNKGRQNIILSQGTSEP